jgi:nitroreductase
MELRSALRTTSAVRAFTDEPVADATIAAILDDARFAPSGGNRQPWRVAVVRDRAIRSELGRLMRPVWDEYVAIAATGVTPFTASGGTAWHGVASPEPPRQPSSATPNELIDGIEHVPVVLAVAADLSRIALMDGGLHRPPMTGGASIHPFCWSILLAAHDRGLGGVLTTFLSRAEADAGRVLGLPPEHALVATLFLGHPREWTVRLRRNEVGAFTTHDRFDGPMFAG